MSLDWAALDRLADVGDVAAASAMLVEATEKQRLAVAPVFEAHVKGLKSEDWWRPRTDPAGVYGLVMLGTMPSAARAAGLLGRRDMRWKWHHIPIPQALDVVRARKLPWLGDLGTRLAGRLGTDGWTSGWPFVAALLAEARLDPPVNEGVVRGWLQQMLWFNDRRVVPLADRLRSDPYLDLIFPSLFEIDGLGTELAVTVWEARANLPSERLAFPEAVVQLVAEGRLDRKTVLDATVDRLARGDRPNALRPFAALHDALTLGVEELAAHTPDYARLLPDAPSAIAGLAQRALRAVDDAGLLELDTSAPTLVRKEKTLVKAQLTWLDRVVRREPGRAPEVLSTIAAAFGHPALDVQERALTLIGKHIAKLDADTRARLADAADSLDGDLPARAAQLFGTVSRPTIAPSSPLPALSPVAAMPPPIDGPVELAEEVAALVHDESAVRWERVLAGLVALRPGDDTSALRSLLEREGDVLDETRWRSPIGHLGSAIRAVLDPAVAAERPDRRWRRLVDAIRAQRANDTSPVLGGPPDRLLTLRIVEVAEQMKAARTAVVAGPRLLATPTLVNGSLDAETLVERLRQAEADGREPWALDFEQALLRLPRGTSPAVAAGLTSAAGRWLAEWLAAGGLPDPVSIRLEQRTEQQRTYHLGPAPESGRFVVNLAPVRPGRLTVEDQLLTLTRRPRLTNASFDLVHNLAMLAATLPHHREVSAAWALPALAALADQDDRGSGGLLPMLAECDGPIGPAMSLSLAYVLSARHESERVAAVDAFLTLAARPDPFAAQVGHDLAALAARGMIKLNRTVLSLADVHRAGGSTAAGELLAVALPVLLPAAPRGLADLLELASRVAAATGAGWEIAGLSELAGRKGSSRLLKEARRLRSVLGGDAAAGGAGGTAVG